MWVDVGVVELDHGLGREELVGVSKTVDDGLEFFDEVVNRLVVFEVVLNH